MSDDRAIFVERIGPGATLQDRGRTQARRYAVPRSGPLDRARHAAAIAAIGADPDDAVLELPLHRATLRAGTTVRLSIDGEPALTLAPGETLEVPASESAVRYVAFEGGIEVPRVLGSRSTFLPAQLGGLAGTMLVRGDRLPLGVPAYGSHAAIDQQSLSLDGPIELHAIAGDQALIATLISREFKIDPRSDRVGTRLLGEALRAERTMQQTSRPMVRGAMQLPPDGLPIVIGPDGPTIGGYPVVAVLTEQACDRLARLRPGGHVRFALVG